jgi:hypothetical protein
MIAKKSKIAIALTVLVMAVFFSSGCQKDTTVYIPLKPEIVTRAVSFSKDLIPLFKTNCAKSGCHVTGGRSPNLEASQAYNALINGKFIDKGNPENSVIYKRLIGKLKPAMPMGASANPSDIDGLLLAWIKQGAKKNN